MNTNDVPDAELAIAPGCPHCQSVLGAMTEMLKQGDLGQLRLTNVATRPAFAQEHGIRSVPWMRIGPFELSGVQSRTELKQWIKRAASEEGQRDYLSEQLEQGGLDDVISACRRTPALLPPLLDLAADLETPFAVRIGIGAVLEDLGPDGLLTDFSDTIEQRLAESKHPQVRADAAHFLGLSGSPRARPALHRLQHDDNPEVRELAEESLQALEAASGN